MIETTQRQGTTADDMSSRFLVINSNTERAATHDNGTPLTFPTAQAALDHARTLVASVGVYHYIARQTVQP